MAALSELLKEGHWLLVGSASYQAPQEAGRGEVTLGPRAVPEPHQGLLCVCVCRVHCT
jgi:hypothetical protein